VELDFDGKVVRTNDQVDELDSGRVLELDVHWSSLSRRLENRLSKKLDDCLLVGGHLSERVEPRGEFTKCALGVHGFDDS
jgi:hypothetical protein